MQSSGVWDATMNLVKGVFETAGTSAPDLIAAGLNLPAYLATFGMNMARNRARNDGRDAINAEDLLYGFTVGVGTGLLEKAHINVLFGKTMTGGARAAGPGIARRAVGGLATEGAVRAPRKAPSMSASTPARRPASSPRSWPRKWPAARFSVHPWAASRGPCMAASIRRHRPVRPRRPAPPVAPGGGGAPPPAGGAPPTGRPWRQ